MARPVTLKADQRLRVVYISKGRAPDLASAVDVGLSASPKSIPSRFFYDETGSELFELITELPEYYLTRSEQWILEQYSDEIVRFSPGQIGIVEFGSGSSKKTRLLLEAALRSQSHLDYVSVDISADFLRSTAARLLADYEGLKVVAVAAEYFDSVDHIPSMDCPRLFLFLGSNIGNLNDQSACDFLLKIRETMAPDDRLLLGMDLAKDPSIIEPAYNDSSGVTARFNKNVLVRVNRELGANFCLDDFQHQAPYSPDLGRVDMLLKSRVEQTVHIPYLGKSYSFHQGETLHTESCRKYTIEDANRLAGAAGLQIANQWFDSSHWFALFLLGPVL